MRPLVAGSFLLHLFAVDSLDVLILRNSSVRAKKKPGTVVLCTDSAEALGFVKRKGASRRTRHVDTKVYFMQAWAMEPGQHILKVHGDSQQVADCLTKIMTPQAAHRRALGL